MKIKRLGALSLLPLIVLSSCSQGYSQISVTEARELYQNIVSSVDAKTINEAMITIDDRNSNSETYERYIFSREDHFYYHYTSSHTQTSETWEFILSENDENYIYRLTRISNSDGVTSEKNVSPYDEESYASILDNEEFWIASHTNTSLTTINTILTTKESSETYNASFYKKDDTSFKVEVSTTYKDTNDDEWPLTYNIEIENNLIKTYKEERGSTYLTIGAKYENVSFSYPDIEQFEEAESSI